MGKAQKTINLALQGGGSHGAFTWGALDRLLEADDQLKIEGISGASAGALNATILAQGFSKGGATAARQALDSFWVRLGEMGGFGLNQRSVVDQMLGNWNIDNSPASMMMDMLQRVWSPYQLNPFNVNPLRDLLSEIIDFKIVNTCEKIKLFIAATNVETGRIRVFTNHELTVDALMASACLPFAFQAVKIDGKPYWDGGYAGNPALFPLIYECKSPDIAVVQINPILRPGTPDTPAEIINRINEISFNASLIGEMRAISFVQRLIDEGHLDDKKSDRWKRMNMHVIHDEDGLRALGAASKTNTDLSFLKYLKEMGRKTTEQWLKDNWDMIGKGCSIDIRKMFLD